MSAAGDDRVWAAELDPSHFADDGSQKAAVVVMFPLSGVTACRVRAQVHGDRMTITLEGPSLCSGCGRQECNREGHAPDYAPAKTFMIGLEEVIP